MPSRLSQWRTQARSELGRRWWSLASRLAYPLANVGCRAFFFTFTRWQVRHADRVPSKGPVIVISNHLHIVDPPIVVACTRRKLIVMAKRELFEVFFAGGYFRAMGTFPVNRFGADIGALRMARSVLREGGALLMFPEGTRSRGGGMRPALPGAAMIALMSGATIVPCAITGSEAIHFPDTLWAWARGRRPHVTLDVGEPFTLPAELKADSMGAEAAIDYMMRRVADLLPEAYRGAYGRHTAGQIVFARHEGTPAAAALAPLPPTTQASPTRSESEARTNEG